MCRESAYVFKRDGVGDRFVYGRQSERFCVWKSVYMCVRNIVWGREYVWERLCVGERDCMGEKDC